MAPSCGRKRYYTQITDFPVRPSQILIDLSKEAEAMSLVSGEKSTSLTRALWPVILAKGFFSSAGFHRNMVKSSEPDTKRSAAGPCGATVGVSAPLQRSRRAHTAHGTYPDFVISLQSFLLQFLHCERTKRSREGLLSQISCAPSSTHSRDPVTSWGLTVAVAGSKAPVRRT